MEDGVLSPATMLGGGAQSDSAMDMDFMDELFLEGCWLETREGSDFLNQAATFIANPNPLFDPLFSYSNFESNAAAPEPKPMNTELVNRSVWIEPRAGSSSDVIEKLYRALMYIKDVIRDKSVLVQIWVPVVREGRRVLTTQGLPFAVDNSCQKLARYRDVSVTYQFSIDDSGEEDLGRPRGLPGRVFAGRVPEWTPDVRFFRKDEYPRLTHAQLHDVRGTLALPVFERHSRACLGVVEVVMTTQNIQYRPELESVCKALEAVDLKSSEALTSQNVRVYNKYYQAALPEIKEVLRSACEAHCLPLAQTWVPCEYQDKEGCRHSAENFGQCVSTVDDACHVADPEIRGFHEACSEHHLFRGEGLVGRAFVTNQPCFSADITSYSKTEYPLSHHAKVFGLRAAVAIRLRSVHAGQADFVLEFFLPVGCTDPAQHMKMLTSLSLIIQQRCRSLRVVSDKELEDEETKPRVRELDFVDEKMVRAEDSGRLKPSAEFGEECSVAGEGSFSSAGTSKTGERRRVKADKTITLQILRQYFAGSLKDAAKSIGVCSTTLKRICRQHGIKRWPSRKIKKVGHSLQKLQLVIDSVQGASGAFQIDSFYSNFPELASPNISGTSPFSAGAPGPKPSNLQPDGAPATAATSKSSSSCSPSSSSSQCCTSSSQQLQNSDDFALKRVRSEAELNKPVEKAMPRSQSQRSLFELQRAKKLNAKNAPPFGRNETQRVKVTFGDEKARFRMRNDWGFGDLQREVARRFGIDDMGIFALKYLDDDSEWVLLTCDADLEECFEVSRACQSNTIKLSLQVSHRVSRGSLGPTAPS